MPDNLPITHPVPDALTLAVWAAHAAVRRELTYCHGELLAGQLEAYVSIHNGRWHAGWSFETQGALGNSDEGYEWSVLEQVSP